MFRALWPLIPLLGTELFSEFPLQLQVTESQNSRGWMDLWRLSSSTPLQKQIHPEKATQLGYESLWRWRLHDHSRQPAPVSQLLDCAYKPLWGLPATPAQPAPGVTNNLAIRMISKLQCSRNIPGTTWSHLVYLYSYSLSFCEETNIISRLIKWGAKRRPSSLFCSLNSSCQWHSVVESHLHP